MTVHGAVRGPFVDRRSQAGSTQHWIERVSALRRAFSSETSGGDVARHALDAYFIHALAAHLAELSTAPDWAAFEVYAFVDGLERTATWQAAFKPQLLLTLIAFYAFLARRGLIEEKSRVRVTRRLQILLCCWIH